jgi:preprotein translocase subunit YajC
MRYFNILKLLEVEQLLERVLNFINFGPAGSTGAAPATGGAATTGAAVPSGSPFGSLWIILIFFVLMYVLLILPQRRQEKKHKKMISELKKGDKILTSSGIIGKILSIQNDRIRITTGDRTDIDITKNAISAVLSKDSSPEKSAPKEEEKKDEDKK